MSTNAMRAARQHRKPRILMGTIAVAGGVPSIVYGQGFTITDQGAGLVRVTLTSPGKRILAPLGMAIEPTNTVAQIVKALAVDTAGTYVDFAIMVVDGTDGVLVDNVGFSFQIAIEEVRA